MWNLVLALGSLSDFVSVFSPRSLSVNVSLSPSLCASLCCLSLLSVSLSFFLWLNVSLLEEEGFAFSLLFIRYKKQAIYLHCLNKRRWTLIPPPSRIGRAYPVVFRVLSSMLVLKQSSWKLTLEKGGARIILMFSIVKSQRAWKLTSPRSPGQWAGGRIQSWRSRTTMFQPRRIWADVQYKIWVRV